MQVYLTYGEIPSRMEGQFTRTFVLILKFGSANSAQGRCVLTCYTQSIKTKRSQRAIKADQLPARYKYTNKAEISTVDLEAWHATLLVRPGETQDRLQALELQVAACFALWRKTQAGMDALEVQLESLRFEIITHHLAELFVIIL